MVRRGLELREKQISDILATEREISMQCQLELYCSAVRCCVISSGHVVQRNSHMAVYCLRIGELEVGQIQREF